MRLFIGIDDTDAGDSIGTGALARELAAFLSRDHGARVAGITRHQLFVHPDIPYTSHNSSACLDVECSSTPSDVHAACRAFVKYLYHPGADPGLCVGTPEALGATPLRAYARRAQHEIVTKDEAVRLAAESGALLQQLGGTGLGIIGALAGCGLRASGDDGRFLTLLGARAIKGEIAVGELKSRVAIDVVADQEGRALGDDEVIDTRGRVRPELRGGRIVLDVRRQDGRHAVTGRRDGEGEADL